MITFPTANKTWAYDTSTGLWHERAFNNDGSLIRHRSNCYAFAYSAHTVGDFENGRVYELSKDVYSDSGTAITRLRTSPHISTGLVRNFFKSFQLDMETGVGLDGTGQGTDPQVMFRFSDDGGHTWSNERLRSAGRIGETKWRVRWHRLGMARNRIFEVKITDPVRVALLGAEIEFEQGAS